MTTMDAAERRTKLRLTGEPMAVASNGGRRTPLVLRDSVCVHVRERECVCMFTDRGNWHGVQLCCYAYTFVVLVHVSSSL